MPAGIKAGKYDLRINQKQRQIIHAALKEHLDTDMSQKMYNNSVHLQLNALTEMFDPKHFHLESGGVLNDCTSQR